MQQTAQIFQDRLRGLDNDKAGHKAAGRIARELLEEWEVEVNAHFPEQKDWNEELLSTSQEEIIGQVMAI